MTYDDETIDDIRQHLDCNTYTMSCHLNYPYLCEHLLANLKTAMAIVADLREENKRLREELSHSILEATAHLVEAKADALVRAEKAEAEVVKLQYVLSNYMSQFGQALEAYDIPYGPAQQEASDLAFEALGKKGE